MRHVKVAFIASSVALGLLIAPVAHAGKKSAGSSGGGGSSKSSGKGGGGGDLLGKVPGLNNVFQTLGGVLGGGLFGGNQQSGKGGKSK